MTTTAIDSSVTIAWLQGQVGEETERLDTLIRSGDAVLTPVTVTELLSGRRLLPEVAELLSQMPVVRTKRGYWERTGRLRSELLKRGRKAGLGDAFIAQACIDHDVPLLTCDRDFAAFAEFGGLKLA
jgi:hypothetical protein